MGLADLTEALVSLTLKIYPPIKPFELVMGVIDTGALVTMAEGPTDGVPEVLYLTLTTCALKLAEVELLNVSVPRKLNPVSP